MGQVFKREVVNADYYGTWGGRRCGELNVEDVDGAFAEFTTENQRNADERSVGQRLPYGEIWPAPMEAIHCLRFRNVEGVIVFPINACERFDQVRRITLIAGEPSSNRVSINGDTQ